MEIATLKYKKMLLESVRNSTIYNAISRMYYHYFTFKGVDYTRNIIFSLFLLQIFFQRNIFRKLRIKVITLPVSEMGQYFLSYLRKCVLQTYEACDFWGLHKNNYMFHFTFFKNVSVSFVVSLKIKRDITLNKRATVHIWFIEPWRINGISFSI